MTHMRGRPPDREVATRFATDGDSKTKGFDGLFTSHITGSDPVDRGFRNTVTDRCAPRVVWTTCFHCGAEVEAVQPSVTPTTGHRPSNRAPRGYNARSARSRSCGWRGGWLPGSAAAGRPFGSRLGSSRKLPPKPTSERLPRERFTWSGRESVRNPSEVRKEPVTSPSVLHTHKRRANTKQADEGCCDSRLETPPATSELPNFRDASNPSHHDLPPAVGRLSALLVLSARLAELITRPATGPGDSRLGVAQRLQQAPGDA